MKLGDLLPKRERQNPGRRRALGFFLGMVLDGCNAVVSCGLWIIWSRPAIGAGLRDWAAGIGLAFLLLENAIDYRWNRRFYFDG